MSKFNQVLHFCPPIDVFQPLHRNKQYKNGITSGAYKIADIIFDSYASMYGVTKTLILQEKNENIFLLNGMPENR